MVELGLRSYHSREQFLKMMTRRLSNVRRSSISFSKFSPAPLRSSDEFIRQLTAAADRGAPVKITVCSDEPWVEDLAAFLATKPRIQFVRLSSNCCFSCPPVLLIGNSDVFLHLSWPSVNAPIAPYLGVHLWGSRSVRPIARDLRRLMEIYAGEDFSAPL